MLGGAVKICGTQQNNQVFSVLFCLFLGGKCNSLHVRVNRLLALRSVEESVGCNTVILCMAMLY